jgi:hypothetical protein
VDENTENLNKKEGELVGAAGMEQEDAELELEPLPFPNARVVKILKENFKKEHQIKREVKIEANKFLGDILSEIATTMDQEEYFTLSIEHFNKAVRKYREIGLNKKRILKIQKILEKQRAELEEIIAEIQLETP